ncbi:Inter-alpha-trypsin inhibitor heavy chain H3 [Eumeta japonica]|uniref:Inter-alpha-trypsin inhibitor heavy chain H3 n=1 Tax=Eumeta variegata TaxID=151549 RepID=A0A4C1VTG4_EUMVA|nr:Inter-alpha-trypsin inhibitor heavy chain H3 [Eumeta japonica]
MAAFGEEESAVPSRQCTCTCLVTMAKIHELRYELLPHPAYSPDLAPCDYYLFPNLKNGWVVIENSLTTHALYSFYKGSEVVVAGRLVSGQPVDFEPTVEGFGIIDDSRKKKTYRLQQKASAGAQDLPLERLWAYLTVKQLLDKRDAADADADRDSLKQRALSIALQDSRISLFLKLCFRHRKSRYEPIVLCNSPDRIRRCLRAGFVGSWLLKDYSTERDEYEFVTPLTSLVVVKPNATSAVNAESVDTPRYDSGYGSLQSLTSRSYISPPVSPFHPYLRIRGKPSSGRSNLIAPVGTSNNYPAGLHPAPAYTSDLRFASAMTADLIADDLIPVAPTSTSTTEVPTTPSPLAAYRLEDYPWARGLIDAPSDTLRLHLGNGTEISLRLAKDRQTLSAGAGPTPRSTAAAGLSLRISHPRLTSQFSRDRGALACCYMRRVAPFSRNEPGEVSSVTAQRPSAYTRRTASAAGRLRTHQVIRMTRCLEFGTSPRARGAPSAAGGAGACTYLGGARPRAPSPRSPYVRLYCVRDGYAGVCCPTASNSEPTASQ